MSNFERYLDSQYTPRLDTPPGQEGNYFSVDPEQTQEFVKEIIGHWDDEIAKVFIELKSSLEKGFDSYRRPLEEFELQLHRIKDEIWPDNNDEESTKIIRLALRRHFLYIVQTLLHKTDYSDDGYPNATTNKSIGGVAMSDVS